MCTSSFSSVYSFSFSSSFFFLFFFLFSFFSSSYSSLLLLLMIFPLPLLLHHILFHLTTVVHAARFLQLTLPTHQLSLLQSTASCFNNQTIDQLLWNVFGPDWLFPWCWAVAAATREAFRAGEREAPHPPDRRHQHPPP